jgi:hypothetical protein
VRSKEAKPSRSKKGGKMEIMTQSNRLKKSSEFVRKEFFPRWDKKREWTIRKLTKKDLKELKIKGPCRGRCERKIKTILIRFLSHFQHNQNSLYFLLIHEICHAVTTGHHWARWRKRMLRASERARRKGNKELSNMILHDLKKLDMVGEEGR